MDQPATPIPQETTQLLEWSLFLNLLTTTADFCLLKGRFSDVDSFKNLITSIQSSLSPQESQEYKQHVSAQIEQKLADFYTELSKSVPPDKVKEIATQLLQSLTPPPPTPANS